MTLATGAKLEPYEVVSPLKIHAFAAIAAVLILATLKLTAQDQPVRTSSVPSESVA